MSPSTNAPDGSELPSVYVLGVRVAAVDRRTALDAIESLREEQPSVFVAYVNAHTLNLSVSNENYRSILSGEVDLVLNDGVGVQLAARMRGQRFPENLNGSDFNPRILERAARRGWSVFFLGAAEGVAEAAATRLKERFPGLNVAGAHHGYFPESESVDVVAEIRETAPDVVMVAMGNPRQEEWLAAHLEGTGAWLGVGVGAFFDFTVGTQRRAPTWMNKIGIEWLYRLLRDPVRLWKRYVVGNPMFLWRAWRARKTDASGAG